MEKDDPDSKTTLTRKLGEFLSCQLGSRGQVHDLKQLSGGWSRRTYAFALQFDNGAAMPSQELVLRAQAKGGMLDVPIEREYLVLKALAESSVPVPRVLGFSNDLAVCGTPFMVMERVAGIAPNLWQPESQKWLRHEALKARLSDQLVEILIGIHELDWRTRGLEVLGVPQPGTCYAAEQVALWEERYRAIKTEPYPLLNEAFGWLRANLPICESPTLVDGDYRIGNMLVGEDGVHAVIDWELATIGDPIRDLGYTTLDYLSGKFLKRGSFLCNGVMEKADFLESYERLSGRKVDREILRFWQAFNMACLAIILLTGFSEFLRGNSRDIRMAWGKWPVYGLMDDIARLLEF
jgi:aminoglycoside phosphotransferase (APT) family kinase protein